MKQEKPKSNNLTLQRTVQAKLALRGWTSRAEIVQCLLLNGVYRDHSARSLANAVSGALHELKANGEAVYAGEGAERFWHYVPEGKAADEILKTFDPAALGLVEGERPTQHEETEMQPAPELPLKENSISAIVDRLNHEPLDIGKCDPVDAEIASILEKVNAAKMPVLHGKEDIIKTVANVGLMFHAQSADSVIAARLQMLEEFLGQFPEG